ncbi:hypothetical protein ACFW1A_28210 [Kitasatospora sp. NPDC058965]|uniref:Imm32 family immunity protein n=1 Tax=Kitasatospora sp. NPDC058965 TaxID=3346682 RepID=UPI0036C778B8
MILTFAASHGELDLSGTREELLQLAAVLTTGTGWVGLTGAGLAGIEVRPAPGPGVSLAVDEPRQLLLITGDQEARELFADNLVGVAEMDDGGHWHVDHYPDHPFLAPGPLWMVVNSPHGGMPRRR